uniref:Uncharacterized protein n=1 Tax=Arundo donax TaxID=35708 RepID=A0A0A9C547_ARUDO
MGERPLQLISLDNFLLHLCSRNKSNSRIQAMDGCSS